MLRTLLCFTVALVACGSEEDASTTTEPAVEHTATSAATECTPAVALATESAASPIAAVRCPAGWIARERSSSLPVAGRFTNASDLIDAFCTKADPPYGVAEVFGVDFDREDVLAVAYDGEVGLYRRGTELWIKRTERACETTRSYRTALYAIPKSADPSEQYCSLACP